MGVGTLLAGAVSVLSLERAGACGIRMSAGPGPDPHAQVLVAEAALRRGNLDEARDVALGLTAWRASVEAVRRAVRVEALAIVRSDGQVDREAASPEQRRRSLERAEAQLVTLADELDDPVALTDVAEALEKFPDTRAQARTILERLAELDLVTSAHGYAALARLRAEAGDAAGSQAALARCGQMTRRASVCGAATGVPSAS